MFSKIAATRRTLCQGTAHLLSILLLAGLPLSSESATLHSNRAAATAVRSVPKSTARSSGAVMEPAFEHAGEQTGLEIWRIKDFKPETYPIKDYGLFYTGDSYIVLSTTVNKNNQKFWDIHFWLGENTSQDEAGTAAILSVQLDDQLGGSPVQHREVQEHESEQFASYFKNGIRYVPGGVASGFAHVDRDAFEKRLFQVKGVTNVRVKQVDATVTSMNRGDCFILDTKSIIYVYVGRKSRRLERLKAINAANQIRDQDHAGKSRVVIVDEFGTEADYERFFSALGGGSRDSLPDEKVGGDDKEFERSQGTKIKLYRVSDAKGSLKVDLVGENLLEPSMLDEKDCFILDTSDSNIYVWIGKKCSTLERSEAMKSGEKYLTSMKRPKWSHVQRVVQDTEPAPFTQCFKNWQGRSELRPRLHRSPQEDLQFEPKLVRISRPLPQPQLTETFIFDQSHVDENGINLVDMGDEVFAWISEPATQQGEALEIAQKYLNQLKRDGVKITIIEKGKEGERFKSAFPVWDADFWEKQNVEYERIRHQLANEV